jgi:hypothetical protein
MKLVLTLMAALLAAPAVMAQNSAQEPPAAAGGATATPITPESSGAHSAPGATTEASPAAPPVPASAAQAPDIAKAVDCATLSQQFGDTLTALTAPTAKTPLDEAVKTASTEQAGAGRKACMVHDYAAGLDGLRQAITTLGRKPIA